MTKNQQIIIGLAIAAIVLVPAIVLGSLLTPGGGTVLTPIQNIPTYTYSVSSNPGPNNFPTLEAALAQASSTQGNTSIYLGSGTFIAPPGGWQICSSNLTIFGNGRATVLEDDNATGSAISMCDSNQRSWITISNLRINNLSGGSSLTGIDFDHFAISTFQNLYVSNFQKSFNASSSGTLYDKFIDNRDSPIGTGTYGYFIGSLVNDTTIMGARTIANGSTTCIGIYGAGTHAENLISDDCETGAAVGLDIGNGTHDITASNFYSEANAIGIQIASNTYALSFVGGFDGDSTSENINNLGGTYCFYNMNVQYANFNHCEDAPNTPDNRWIIPYFTGITTANATSAASTTVFAEETNVTNSDFACGISFVTGAATDAGVMIAGIYGPVPTLDTVSGAPLLVQATATEQNNAAVNTGQIITLPTTRINPGLYYLAIQFQSTSTQYQRNANQTQVVGWTQTITNSTSSQNLPATASGPTNSPSSMPGLRLQTCSQTNTN